MESDVVTDLGLQVKSPMASAIGTVGWRALLKWVLPLGVIIFCSSYTWYSIILPDCHA